MSDAHRYARHWVIREIGPAGQARLGAAHLRVPPGTSGDVAACYLQRAGVRVDEDGSPLLPGSTTPELGIALDTLHGCLNALEAVRRIVGLAPAEALRWKKR